MKYRPLIILCHGQIDFDSDENIVNVINKLRKDPSIGEIKTLVEYHFGKGPLSLVHFRKAKQDPHKIITLDQSSHHRPTIETDLTQPLGTCGLTPPYFLVLSVFAPMTLEKNQGYQDNVSRLLASDGLFVIVVQHRVDTSYYRIHRQFYHETFPQLKYHNGWRGNYWHPTGFMSFQTHIG